MRGDVVNGISLRDGQQLQQQQRQVDETRHHSAAHRDGLQATYNRYISHLFDTLNE